MRLLIAAVAVVVVSTLTSCGPTTMSDACKGRTVGDLVITEFLNDPDGTDTGSEWIEMFNTLGTSIDLKGITVYTKKLDGSSVKSHVIRAGTIESRGYFVLGDVRSGANPSYINYAYEGDLGALSNAEGIIGLKCQNTVFDEVNYTVTPKAAHARQLDGRQTPDSVVNDDETKWCDSPTSLAGTANFGTPGQPNADCPIQVVSGNCIDVGATASRPVRPPLPGQVFFTEVMPDPTVVADTAGEWIEVHSNGDIDLNDTVLTVGTSKKTLTSTSCLRIPAGGYAIFAHDADAGVNGGLPDVLATFSAALPQAGATLTLSLEDAGIDTAIYGASVSGVSWQLDPSKLDDVSNDSVANFCEATQEYSPGGDWGTPGAANTACGSTTGDGGSQCLDTGTSSMRAVVAPVVGDLVISEVMPHPNSTTGTTGEYFEIFSNTSVDLNGLTVQFDSAGTTTLTNANCLHVNAGGFALLARNGDPNLNGGLPTPLATYTFGLTDTGAHSVSVKSGTTVLDTFPYNGSTLAASWQLKPGLTTPADNDTDAGVCVTPTMRWPTPDGGMGDRGTPGAMNETCP